MERIGDAKDVVRETRLEGGDATELPIFEGVACKTFVEMTRAPAYGQRVREVDHAAVTRVEAGVSLFGAKVKGVDRKISVTGGGDNGSEESSRA